MFVRNSRRAAIITFIFLSPWAVSAQQSVLASRADGNQTPLMVYQAQQSSSACAPLALISHGAGGSENGYRYLAEAMAQQGYTTVVMGHRESDRDSLLADMRAHGVKNGIASLVADPRAERDRLLDVAAARCFSGGRTFQ